MFILQSNLLIGVKGSYSGGDDTIHKLNLYLPLTL